MGPVLYILDIFIATFLIIVILLQQGKGSDMGAAFGGSSQTVFGGASGRQSFLVKVTVVLGVLFMLMSLGLSWRASYLHKSGGKLPSIPTEEAPPMVPGGAAPGGNFPAQPGQPAAGQPAPVAPSAPAPVAPNPVAPSAPAPNAPAGAAAHKAPGKK